MRKVLYARTEDVAMISRLKIMSSRRASLLSIVLIVLSMTFWMASRKTFPATPSVVSEVEYKEIKGGHGGRVYVPGIVRKFVGPLVFSSRHDKVGKTRFNLDLYPKVVGQKLCEKWTVITTIFPPTSLVEQLSKLDKSWCTVIVGDKRSPTNYTIEGGGRIVYLGPHDQLKLPYKIVPLLPWNHFGRKNVGYLYAIHHGAQIIYDTDDDNILKVDLGKGVPVIPVEKLGLEHSAAASDTVNVDNIVYNPYPSFRPLRPDLAGAPHAQFEPETFLWPRGFPLDLIRDIKTFHSGEISEAHNTSVHPKKFDKGSVTIVQSLADNDPDVDAIYRLTRSLPVQFSREGVAGIEVIPEGVLSPFNAQATIFSRSAFWGLLLPISVTGRVSDIWRSYFTGRLLWSVNQRLAFASPWVTQCRNPHNYLADLDAESDLYSRSGVLVSTLLKWTPTSTSLAGQMEELIIKMFEIDILHDVRDVYLHVAWLQDLIHVGFTFPPIAETSAELHELKSQSDPLGAFHVEIENSCLEESVRSPSTWQKMAVQQAHEVRQFWTSDLHDGTRVDLTSLLMDLGHEVLNMGQKRDKGPHPLTLTRMKKPKRALSPAIPTSSLHLTEANVRDVFEYYKNDTDLFDTDAFICQFPVSMCELFIPFNRSIIMVASHRLFLGRCSLSQALKLVQHVQDLSQSSKHFILASNLYDSEYINFYTGLKVPVLWASSFGYQFAGYNVSREEILVGPLQLTTLPSIAVETMNRSKLIFTTAKQLYGRFETQDLCNHRAMVMIPYAVHSYGTIEVYSLSIPIFAPSIDLALKLNLFGRDKNVNDDVYCGGNMMFPDMHNTSKHKFSPEDRSQAAQRYWLQYGDLYQFPHIQYFDSFDELETLILQADLHLIHRNMKLYNSKKREYLSRQLSALVHKLPPKGTIPTTWEQAVAPWGNSIF